MEKIIEKGTILDGVWEFVGYINDGSTMYEFKNIYNGKTIKLSNRQVKQVMDGKDSISHIISRRLRNNPRQKNSPVWWSNSVKKSFGKQVHKFESAKKNS